MKKSLTVLMACALSGAVLAGCQAAERILRFQRRQSRTIPRM